jgi:putative ABC transport system substrate-binding protein
LGYVDGRNIKVEYAATDQFVTNLKTAKTLGLTIPPSVLARADEIIE